MKSKINDLSMREILNKISFPIVKNEFRNTYKFNVDLDMAMDFEDELSQMQEITEIEQIIYDYEEIFDKELYIFHIARLLKQDLENLKRAEILGNDNIEQLVFTNDKTGKNKRRFFVNAKNLLKTCDVVDIVMKQQTDGEFEIYSSIDFIEENSENSNNRRILVEEKLENIERKIGLENVLTYFNNSDLIELCKYPNLATLLIVNQGKFEEKVRKYIQYMDIDKMLILANTLCFYKYSETLDNFSKEDAKKLKKFTQNVSEIVGDDIKPIKTAKLDFIVDYNDIKIKIQNLVDDEKLEKEILEYFINFVNVENKTLIDCKNMKETIFKVDENANQEELEDGTNIFYLPNKGCYIIQPVNNSMYGNATYIIEKDLFEKQKDKLINDKKISIMELENLKLDNSNSITKLVHTGWENSLTTFFDMERYEKYTKEEIENIEKIINEIKK